RYFPATSVKIYANVDIPAIRLPQLYSNRNPGEFKRLQSEIDNLHGDIAELKSALRRPMAYRGQDTGLVDGEKTNVDGRNGGGDFYCPPGTFAVGLQFRSGDQQFWLRCRQLNVDQPK